ncbi:MAG: ABC transporter substrate-binding protein [Phycisphaerales bacterium]
MRVVSLLPSATETLSFLGGSDLLVGRSHECDFPEGLAHLPTLTSQIVDFHQVGGSAGVDQAVRRALSACSSQPEAPSASENDADRVVQGGLYTLDTRLLRELRPDVILTQDLCEVCSIDLNTVRAVAREMSPAPRIVSLNPTTFEHVLDDCYAVGEAVGLEAQAEERVAQLRERYYRAANFVNPFTQGPRVAFLEWTDPPFIGGHWTPQLIERAGASHPLNPTEPLPGAGAGEGQQAAFRVAGKSIRVPTDAVAAVRPEAVIVCPCGLDLPTTRAEFAKIADQPWIADTPAAKSGRIALVDGNQMFNRPGPRLVDAFEFLVGYLNDLPDLIPEGFPWERWAG